MMNTRNWKIRIFLDVKSFVERMAILASLSRIVAVKWDALK